MKLPERNEGNFFMFLKTNEGYLSQIALKNMQFLVNYTLGNVRSFFCDQLANFGR